MLDQSELQALLLDLIAEAPRHGYELIRAVEEQTQGGYAPSPGVVYPSLTYMEEAGFIRAEVEEGGRKAYRITDEGEVQRGAAADTIAAVGARLAALAEQRERTDAAPVRRAMQGLKSAIFDRLADPSADRALVLQVADAIDEAAKRIERIEA